jgi:hypothetical protein
MNAEQTSLMKTMPLSTVPTENQIDAIKQKFDPTKFNAIFYTSTVMDMLPAGVVMVPTVIHIPQHELWDKAADKKLSFLPDGMVELSAPAIKRIGMVSGVKLEKHDERVHTIMLPAKPQKTGYNGNIIPAEPAREATMLLIEYRASMMLPDGTVHSEVSGKEEEYIGQHAREKIDTKAKRNAIKALLNIPLTLPRANVDKPFIVFKPIFHRGHSTETDAILDRIEGAKTYAMDMLYPGSASPAPWPMQAIPVQSSASDGEISLAEITDMIRTAPDIDQLDSLVSNSADIPKTEAQRKAIVEAYSQRKTELGEVKL